MAHGDRFRRKALKRGYKVDEVDNFLERAEATLGRRVKGEPVTASDVRDVVFRTRFGGYDEWQVDLHLDRLEKELEELSSGITRGSNGFRALEAGPSAYREQERDFREEPAYDRAGYRDEPPAPAYRDEPPAPGYRDEPVVIPPYRDEPTYDRPAYREEPAYERAGFRAEPAGVGYRDEPIAPPYRDEPTSPGYDRDYRDEPAYERAGFRDERAAPYRDDRGYDRDYPAEPAYAREPEFRREPAEYRNPVGTPGYRPDAPYREDRPYRDPEVTGTGSVFGGPPSGLAGVPGGAGPVGVPSSAAVTAGIPVAPRGGPREAAAREMPQVRGPLFAESFNESLPPARPLDPEYGASRGADMTTEIPAATAGGQATPFTHEDKGAVSDLRSSFRPRRFGSGYDPAQVERLFDAVQATMDGRGGRVSEADLAPAQFGLVQGGYFEDDVDGALRELRQLFSRRMG